MRNEKIKLSQLGQTKQKELRGIDDKRAKIVFKCKQELEF